MCLILSPHSNTMSSTAVENSHSSPPFKQSPPSRNGSERSPRWQVEVIKNEEKNGRLSSHASNSSDGLIDPFLAQYMKPTSSINHELYFQSLNKQVHIKSSDYYQKYLKQNNARSPKSVASKHGRIISPLAKELISVTDLQKDDEKNKHSPPRRRRQAGPDVSPQPGPKRSHSEVYSKVLSSQFQDCSVPDLINLISRMIHSLINLNDQSVPSSISGPFSAEGSDCETLEKKKKLLTRYHSRTPPAISIHTYLSRLAKFNNFSPGTLLSTIYYVDLLSHNFQPYFTLNSWTVHRFLLVATMLAQKALEDFFYTNDHYAKVGGVALTELNCLELDFLTRVNWKLVPAKQISPTQTSIRYSKEVLDLYYSQLVNLMGKNVTDQNNIIYVLED